MNEQQECAVATGKRVGWGRQDVATWKEGGRHRGQVGEGVSVYIKDVYVSYITAQIYYIGTHQIAANK